MVMRFAWIAAFVLLASPALGQTAEFFDEFQIPDKGTVTAKVKSDDGVYKHCENCELVKISMTGPFWMRTRCC
jgi:hypothetical protein